MSLTSETLGTIERYAVQVFSDTHASQNTAEVQAANFALSQFMQSDSVLADCRFILTYSNEPACIYFGFLVLKNHFTSKWKSISAETRQQVRLPS